MENLIQLRNVTKIYQQGKVQVHAVQDLTLGLALGEFSALCGPSGSGKTTVLNLIGALDEPSQGTILLEGNDLALLNRTQLSRLRRDRIGFVFQAYNLVPVLTAYENAEFVLALQGVPAKERYDRTMTILDEVGLAGLANRRPDELSGGQQQRVAIARAICPEPAVVLADEPTANVDTTTADGLLGLMEKLNDEKRITFLFSTHDQRVMDRAHRLIRLTDGQLTGDEVRR
ncbi:MAG: ABC transporter ATP-binding protein [Proteobacteria bacterium]|nr:ABC transporter ATP-binding protein [Pseudomonadota bacterium]MBU1686696.1 ABC transporter ATP-binding protein [Pseudomonadota bacterium]